MATAAKKTPITGLISDVIISLSAEDVANSGGFSLDIGSSVAKLIYRSVKEYKKGVPIEKPENPERGNVHYALFPRNDVEGVTSYLKDNCDFKRNDDGVVEVHCSGVGGSSFKKTVEKELNAKIFISSEMNAFVDGFKALTKIYSKDELVHPCPVKDTSATDEMQAVMEKYKEKMKEMGSEFEFGPESKGDGGGETTESDNPHLPCLLAMCGSGVAFFKVDADGTHRIYEGPVIGGRAFYGLAALHAGTNDFKKIMEMVKKGDGKTVDTWTKDLMPEKGEDDEDDAYNAISFDMLMFPFGKAVEGQEADIKKEDIIHSLYNTTAILHVQFAYMYQQITGYNRVYFCGNLFDNEIGRKLIFTRKQLIDGFTPPDRHVDIQFVKNGGMLGVLGAFTFKEKKPEHEDTEQTQS